MIRTHLSEKFFFHRLREPFSQEVARTVPVAFQATLQTGESHSISLTDLYSKAPPSFRVNLCILKEMYGETMYCSIGLEEYIKDKRAMIYTILFYIYVSV